MQSLAEADENVLQVLDPKPKCWTNWIFDLILSLVQKPEHQQIYNSSSCGGKVCWYWLSWQSFQCYKYKYEPYGGTEGKVKWSLKSDEFSLYNILCQSVL